MKFLAHLAGDYQSAALDELDVIIEELGLQPRSCYPRPCAVDAQSGAAVPDPRVDRDVTADPIQELDLPGLDAAKRLLARAVMVKGLYQVWSSGRTLHDVVHSLSRDVPPSSLREACGPSHSWRFIVEAFGAKVQGNAKDAVRKHFDSVLRPLGPVSLGTRHGADTCTSPPDVSWAVFLDYGHTGSSGGTSGGKRRGQEQKAHTAVEGSGALSFPADVCLESGLCLPSPLKPARVWFGIRVGVGEGEGVLGPGERAGDTGARRHLMNVLSLKTRPYLGPTSLDSQLALLMCSLGGVRRGYTVYDPFVGTGSTLVAAAASGAFTLGSDLDMRVLRGKLGRSLSTNFSHYGLGTPELLRMDAAGYPSHLRGDGWADAIITDPPYGIRAGARKTGGAGTGVGVGHPPSHPSLEAHDPDAIIIDLLDLAARILVVGGTCVYLYPSLSTGARALTGAVGCSSAPFLLPHHPCLSITRVSEEALTPLTARFVVSMVKVGTYDEGRRGEYREVVRRSARAAAVGSEDEDGGGGGGVSDRLGNLLDGWYAANRSRLSTVAGEVMGTRAPHLASLAGMAEVPLPVPATGTVHVHGAPEDRGEGEGGAGLSRRGERREKKRLVRQAKRHVNQLEQQSRGREGGEGEGGRDGVPRPDAWEAPALTFAPPPGVTLSRKERHLLAILADHAAGRAVRISGVPYDLPSGEWGEFKRRVGLPHDFPLPPGLG